VSQPRIATPIAREEVPECTGRARVVSFIGTGSPCIVRDLIAPFGAQEKTT
jgi:hypothetical protein